RPPRRLHTSKRPYPVEEAVGQRDILLVADDAAPVVVDARVGQAGREHAVIGGNVLGSHGAAQHDVLVLPVHADDLVAAHVEVAVRRRRRRLNRDRRGRRHGDRRHAGAGGEQQEAEQHGPPHQKSTATVLPSTTWPTRSLRLRRLRTCTCWPRVPSSRASPGAVMRSRPRSATSSTTSPRWTSAGSSSWSRRTGVYGTSGARAMRPAASTVSVRTLRPV